MNKKRIVGLVLVALVALALYRGFGVEATGPGVDPLLPAKIVGAKVKIVKLGNTATANGFGVFGPGVEIQVMRLEKPGQFVGTWDDPQKGKIVGAVPYGWVNETIDDGSKAIERAQRFSIAAMPTWGPSCGCDWTPQEMLLVHQLGPKVLELVLRTPGIDELEIARAGLIPLRKVPPWFNLDENLEGDTAAVVIVDDPAGNPDGIYFTHPLYEYGRTAGYKSGEQLLAHELVHWIFDIGHGEVTDGYVLKSELYTASQLGLPIYSVREAQPMFLQRQ